MKTCIVLISLLLTVFLISCDGGKSKEGGDKESVSEQESKKQVTAPGLKTFEFTWSAICRCYGETGGRRAEGERGAW
jgi:hypothetical protein